MNPIVTILASAVLVLAGCAATPPSSTTVLEITGDEIQDYWIPTSEVVSTQLQMTDVQTRSGRRRAMAHTVEVTYLIGSDGKVRDARVLSTDPANASGQWAVAGVSASAYDPAPGNTAGVPVRLTHTMTLVAPPDD